MDALLGPFCSTSMREIARTVGNIAASDLSVLIAGESGTGKEWLARCIHRLSDRKDQPFVPVFCNMLTPEHAEKEIFGSEETASMTGQVAGAFEYAQGGVLFFDDIANLPVTSQLKLAAALERGSVRRIGGTTDIPASVRVIATVDTKPDSLVAEGKLRKELFFRITPIILEMPPLRDRVEDIPVLIEKLVLESNKRHGCSVLGMDADAMKLCMAYGWPGNIRELRNAIDYAVLMSRDSIISSGTLPQYVFQPRTSGKTFAVQNTMNVASVEKLLIEQALMESRTKKQAAKRLGISLKTLYNKLNRYNLYDKFVNYSRVKPQFPVAEPDEAINPDLLPHEEPVEPGPLMRF